MTKTASDKADLWTALKDLAVRLPAGRDGRRNCRALARRAAIVTLAAIAALAMPTACSKAPQKAQFKDATITLYMDLQSGKYVPDSTRATVLKVTDQKQLEALLAFFPEMDRGKESWRAAGWEAGVEIKFARPDGKTIRVSVSSNDDLTIWSEGHGDWPVNGDLKAFLLDLQKGQAATQPAAQMVLHIVSAAEWQRARQAGSYEPTSLGSGGFVHCSTPEQIVSVANANFRGKSGLVLLCINPKRLKAPVMYENLEGGTSLFPHIYGPVNLEAVVEVLDFAPQQDGTFLLPAKLVAVPSASSGPAPEAARRPAAPRPATKPAQGPVQTDWSELREGVQMRLRAARKTWRADEIPALRWDVRNVGTRKFLQVGDGQRLAQLEVDGVWHQWPTGLRSARLADMGAGAWLEDQLVTASPIWSRATPEDLEWRRDGGGKIVLSGEEPPPSLHLKPGAHTLHVAVVIQPSRADTGDGFRVVSEPMDITIEALPAGQTASWPPGTKLAQAVKEALYRAQIPLQNSLRPWEPGMKDWIAGALAKAKQAATLAEKKPLHASASRLADAFAALQQAVDKDPAGAAKEFSAAGDAYRDLVGVFAGVTRPAPSGAGTQPAAEASATIATFAKLPPATQSATAPLAGSRLAAPATQPAAQLVLQTRNIELMQKRDALLARADADIRAGLLALAKEFPQIAQADGWKAVAGKSRAGEVNLGLYWKVEAYPKTASPRGDAFALTVILSLGRPAGTQPAWLTLYGNLGLVGKAEAKAGDPKLDAALKTLVADAMAPLDELDKHIGAATQSATPRASPPTSVPIDPAAAWEAKVGQTITLQGHAIRQKSGIIYLRPADDACPYWSVELEHVLPDLRGGGAPLPVRVTGTLRLRKHTFSQEEVEQYKRDLAEGKKQMQAGNREVGQIIRHYYIPDAVVTILPVATQPAPQPATRPAGPSQAARAGAMNPATTRPAEKAADPKQVDELADAIARGRFDGRRARSHAACPFGKLRAGP